MVGAMCLNKLREPLRMADVDRDAPLRLAAFEHVRRLGETHEHLTATKLKPGFVFKDERVPLMNRCLCRSLLIRRAVTLGR